MKKLTNPNFIYICTFIIPFFVYTLGWSSIYPALTSKLFGFYIVTFSIAFLTGIVIDRLTGFVYHPIPIYKHNLAVIICLYLLYCLDFWYTGFVPMFAYSGGQAGFREFKIGIPTFHVVLVTFTIFFSLYLFHQYLSHRKWSLLLLYISSFGFFVMLLERSSIMYIFIGSIFLFFISQKRIFIKKIIGLGVLSLFILYMFGYLGNMRSTLGDPEVIPRMSGATDKFMDSRIPKEYYWSYLYIASPVANLQNNINLETNVVPNYAGFLVFEMIPDFAAKRLADLFSVAPREFQQILPWLNVGTIYALPFSYLSWAGVLII